ncbi:MAG: adenosylcobinamide-GDP ribazoletransferase, partial [Desulfonatronovibrio sp. MSAO_Bac4]
AAEGPSLSMILTNGLRTGQTSSNGENQPGCRLYPKVEDVVNRYKKFIMKFISDFFLTLSFLSRLARPKCCNDDDMGRTLPWFSLVGLVLGLLVALPVFLGIAKDYPLVQAWIILSAGFYITRGLHWDGWADLWDAWASQAKDDRFWQIIKDSRIGAFGVMGLIIGMGGQLILLHEAARQHLWVIIVWAYILGRLGAVILAYSGKKHSRPGLARLFLTDADKKALSWNLFVMAGFGLLFIDIKIMVFSLLLLCLGIYTLYSLGRKKQGINGDFLGSAIIWGELSGLLAITLV